MAKVTSFLVLLVFGFCLRQIAGIPSFAAECLKEHNQFRAEHGARPLQWDATLAAHAQKWADHLNSLPGFPTEVHEPNSREGENILNMGSPSCNVAIEEWGDELYDYTDYGYCSKAPRMVSPYMMHYTQLVWKSTTKVGVGIAGDWLVARYSPGGNRYGHYKDNVAC